MSTPVGLISNASGGHNRDRFPDIEARLERSPAIRHIETKAAADIPAALAELAERGVRVLAINGGDGTAAAILGQLLEREPFGEPPVIALLPGGTANMTAGDVGVRGGLEKATRRFCDWCDAGATLPADLQRRAVLKVVAEGEKTPHYAMFLGGGAIVQGTEYAHRKIHSRGLRDDLSLALGTARTVWGVFRDDPAFNRPVRIRLALDRGEPRIHDTLILAASTLNRLAFGMRPFWGRGAGTIRLTLMERRCTRFPRTFVSIARGRPNANAVPKSGYFSHNADFVTLNMQGKLNLDGEIIDVDGNVSITASRELRFLRL